MTMNIKKEFNRTVITIDALSLTGDAAKEFKEKASDIIDSGELKLCLEFHNTNFLDSSGIGKLLFLNKKLNKLNGEFEIIKINKDLYSFLDSLAITKVIKIAKPQ
ncbi:MAG: STAS domain-containing protein [Spirochaetales bacterium]|nr:STAS domain-containing protein [Spirochaetales bacterium]